MIRRVWIAVCAGFLVALVSGPVWAHKPSDAYLTLEAAGAAVDARWDIALRDLEYAMHLDTDDSGSITWGELRNRRSDVEAYAFERLTVSVDGLPCPKVPTDLQVVEHSDGTYAALRFRFACPRAPVQLDVKYSLFFDIDPQHHGLLRLRGPGGERTAIFTATAPMQRFEMSDTGRAQSFFSAVREGIGHIWAGIDHLLFLLALLLPSVLRREGGAWRPVSDFKAACRDVLGIVTAFTVAHSITLSLAALDVVRLPSRLVEAGIAASVVLAAVNNLVPILRGERRMAAFALGLLHGFGFSAVLVDLGLSRDQLVRVLLGFNVGVELGQFAAVALFLPLAYLVRTRPLYRRLGLLGGSAAIAAVAAVWFIERAFVVT